MYITFYNENKHIIFCFDYAEQLDGCMCLIVTDEFGGAEYHPLLWFDGYISYDNEQYKNWFLHNGTPNADTIEYDKDLSHGAWDYFDKVLMEEDEIFSSVYDVEKNKSKLLSMGFGPY